MHKEPVDLEELLLSLLAADNDRRRSALRVLRGETETPVAPSDEEGVVLLRPGEAARYLGISRTTLWRLAREGRLERVEIRQGSYRFRKAELQRFAHAKPKPDKKPQNWRQG